MTNERASEDENLLFTREELASDIASILKGDEYSPEALAHLFIILRGAIAGGLEGINRASETLDTAVELTFKHSRAHAVALRLYLLAQEGQLKAEDEPVRLIGAAIERNTGVTIAGKAYSGVHPHATAGSAGIPARHERAARKLRDFNLKVEE